MYDAHDPRVIEWGAGRAGRERAFQRWCSDRRLDPRSSCSNEEEPT